MGLNNIEITDFIVGEWYKDNLVAQPSTPRSDANSNYAEFGTITPGSQNTTTPSSSTPLPSATPVSSAAPLPSTPSAAPLPSTSAPLKFLGGNRRNITLLVNSTGTPFLPDNHLAFLTKILAACHLTIADVAIVNHAAAAVTITALRQQLQPKTVLLFGLEPTTIRLPINFPVFKLQSYDDCTYLSAPALDQLVPDTDESKLEKSKLWVCLKALFNV
jgi:hypothetical protein